MQKILSSIWTSAEQAIVDARQLCARAIIEEEKRLFPGA